MNKPLNTILVGAGGYGETFINILLSNTLKEHVTFAGVIDPYIKNSRMYEAIKSAVPIYDNLDDFFRENTADLTIISTPIHLHFSQCITAMENGSHVLCEKPLVPTLGQLKALEQKSKETGKVLSVGFQTCFSDVFTALKARVISGEFGKPIRLKSLVCAPRGWGYYSRGSGWAGKIMTEAGEPIYDSVASNATAHYIQNMLFILGESTGTSADLHESFVECYRANNIESYDTIVFTGQAANAEIFYAATHASNFYMNPVMEYRFEKADMLVNVFSQDFHLVIHHRDGRIEDLGELTGNGEVNKILHTAQSILGQGELTCSLETVRPFTAFIERVFMQTPVKNFPDALIVKDAVAEQTYVKGLHLDLMTCFNTMLPLKYEVVL